MLESLFNKVAGPRASIFIKKRLQQRCFSVKLAQFLRKPSLKNTSFGCFCTYCTHMTSHAIGVDEITDIIVTIKKMKRAKTFWKHSFWNRFYIVFHFLPLCVFISIHNIGRSIPLRKKHYRRRYTGSVHPRDRLKRIWKQVRHPKNRMKNKEDQIARDNFSKLMRGEFDFDPKKY